MSQRKIVLVDTDIVIDLFELDFKNLLIDLSRYYEWEITMTPGILSEFRDSLILSHVNSMRSYGTIKILVESSEEVAKAIVELDKFMVPGKEIELFAIAKCRKYSLLTHDRENTDTYFKNYPFDKGSFWVYNLYHVLYLAYKATILSMAQVASSLSKIHKKKKLILNRFILKNGFEAYCHEIDKFQDRHIDPCDASRFLS